MAEFHIYAMTGTNEKMEISKLIAEFKNDSICTTNIQKAKILEALHPDGSLMIICEVEFLAPAETFAKESEPAMSVVFPKIGFLQDMLQMWIKQIFADCTIKV